MAGKINVFNLGANGVDLVKSPLHIADGAWRQLTNAEFNPDHAQGGVKKRGSLTAVNATPLAGAVRALVNVPLPLDSDVFLMLAMNADETETFKASEDGAAFTDVDAATMPRILQDPIAVGSLATNPNWRMASYRRALYYPGDDYVRNPDANFTNPPLLVRTDIGTTYELFRVPPNPTDPTGSCISITDMIVQNGLIYFGTHDSGGVSPDAKGRVLSFNPVNGVITEVGNRFGDGVGENTAGFPMCFASYQGRLFCGTYGISGNNLGKIYSIIAGVDDTWVLDFTAALHNGYITTMAAYGGKLYAGTDSDTSGTALIKVRAEDGTWSTTFTAPAAQVSQFDGLIVYDGNLYCAWRGGALLADCLIKRFDGSSWTTALDVAAAHGSRYSGTPFVFKGDLYWPFSASSVTGGTDGFLLKYDGSTWTKPLNNIGVRGPLGKFSPDTA